MKGGCWLVGLAVVAVLVIGCGGAGQAETHAEGNSRPAKPRKAAAEHPPEGPLGVMVTAEGWENPADLGIVVAQQRGYFEDVGINIWVGAPAMPHLPVKYVSAGADTFGVAQLPQVAIAKEKGAPIIAVGSLVSQPTAAMIWLKRSKIRTIADLRGKTIAIPGVPYQEQFLAGLLEREGLALGDVHVKAVGYELVPALLSGQADAIFGGSWNLEGIELKTRGVKPVITRMQSLGAPPYEELVVIVRKDLAIEYPEFIRDFMSAVARGTAVALRNPRAAIRMMIDKTDESNPNLGSKVIEAQVKATLPLLSRTSRMDPSKGDALIGWMSEEEMIQRQMPASELLTNEYLQPEP